MIHYSLKSARAEAAALRARGVECKIYKHTPAAFALKQTISYYVKTI